MVVLVEGVMLGSGWGGADGGGGAWGGVDVGDGEVVYMAIVTEMV